MPNRAGEGRPVHVRQIGNCGHSGTSGLVALGAAAER